MQKLNLAHLEESDIKYSIVTFPDGEPHITIESPIGKERIKVKTRICNPTDLMILMEVNDILERAEVYWDLNISYLMSARMDRVMSLYRPVTLKIVANILSGLSCRGINVLDTHNHDKLLQYIYSNRPHPILTLEGGFASKDPEIIVLPDEGSKKRYPFTIDCDKIVFDKVRDLNTGKILSFKIIEAPDIIKDGAKYTFIDDLCDGGGTFLGELSILKETFKCGECSINITHCVNEEGLRKLLNTFDKVYTTNSYKDWDLIFPEQVKSGRLIVHKVI